MHRVSETSFISLLLSCVDLRVCTRGHMHMPTLHIRSSVYYIELCIGFASAAVYIIL